METRTATDAAANVPSMLEVAIRGGCTTITKNGKPKAVVVPVELYERLDELEDDEDTFGVRAVRASRAEVDAAEEDPERLALISRIKELEGGLEP